MLEIITELYDDLETVEAVLSAQHSATYALGHVSRILGARLVVDIDEAAVLKYQEDRLCEKAARKSINEEVRFL